MLCDVTPFVKLFFLLTQAQLIREIEKKRERERERAKGLLFQGNIRVLAKIAWKCALYMHLSRVTVMFLLVFQRSQLLNNTDFIVANSSQDPTQ